MSHEAGSNGPASWSFSGLSPDLEFRREADDGFHAALKRGVASYFEATRRSRWGGAAMHAKTAMILGWFAGLFINYASDVLPITRRFSHPACSECQTPFSLADYLTLRPCRKCGKSRSLRTWLVQILAVGAFVYFWLFPSRALGIPLGMLVLIYFGIIIVIDLEHRILPDLITLPGIAVGFVCSFFMPPGWLDSLLGIVLGGGSLWLMGEAYLRLRHEEGMGFGDVKMLAMIGAFLGWKLMLVTLVFASFAGSLVGVGMLALGRGDMKYALPFGTFLAVGALVAAVAGDPMLDWYLGFYQ